jgi:hypothetical protein
VEDFIKALCALGQCILLRDASHPHRAKAEIHRLRAGLHVSLHCVSPWSNNARRATKQSEFQAPLYVDCPVVGGATVSGMLFVSTVSI